jgi:hypothetical protein
MKNFIERLNWRQVLIHSLACWFFAVSFETFSYLFHLKTIDAVRTYGLTDTFQESGVTTGDLSLLLVWKTLAGAIGWLAAFFISLFLSIKRGWFWVNSLLSLVFTILLLRIDLWEYTRVVFYFPGKLASVSYIEFLINGTLLLSIGLFLFFAKPIIRFITGGPKTE